MTHELPLPKLGITTTFVEGTRDPFCPLDTLERALGSIKASTSVVVIDDGDHSFKVPKTSGRSTEAAWQEVIEAVAGWVRERIR